MFVPPPQVNPRKSLESSKPTIPTKPTIKSGESPRKLLEVQTINIFNSDDSDDSDDLFKPPPQVNPRKSSASRQMSTESTTKSPEVFKPIITPQDLLSKLPQLKKNQSHDSGNDKTEPKSVQEKMPEIKSTPSWNDDSDDSDDMFKPSPPQVIPRKSLEPSKPSLATKPTIKSEELQRKLPDIKSNDSWKAESYFDDSDDSDDLFKLPPKVNPRKSLKSTKISTESTSKSPDVIEPSTTPQALPRKLPELKTDPNHDREDDEESFEPTKNVHEILPESKSNPSWILDPGHDSDDSDDLFKPPPQVNPRKSLESKKLPPESTSKSPEIFKPLTNPPGSLKKIPQLKTNQNHYSEDDDDEYEEIFQATQKDLKNSHKNLPEIKSNNSWNPDSDSDDSDDLFKLPPQVNPRKSIESTKPTLPTTPTVKSEEQPRKLPEITSTNTLNFASDSDDSDDLFKQPPRITPRKSSDTTSPKEVPVKLFENKFDQSWNLDSDSDDDLFKIKK
ncbi:nucleolar protein dao-5-like [Panonychus citri]|uniref:nucleolar protein dao-5-like n=1 Tax=Panonychus citri TaxID=50023 RepID=UPI002307F13F|nr:nucleolar protein dao-5-like [Panonychus citri]